MYVRRKDQGLVVIFLPQMSTTSTSYPLAAMVSQHPKQFQVWQSRLTHVYNALKTWDLRVANRVKPYLLARLLHVAGLGDAVVNVKKRKFISKPAVAIRKAAKKVIKGLRQSWTRLSQGRASGNVHLAIIEEELQHMKEVMDRKTNALRIESTPILHRLLMTPGDALRVSYTYVDAFGTYRTALYPVKYLQFERKCVTAAFYHQHTDMIGNRVARIHRTAFMLPTLESPDGRRSRLLVAQAGTDFNLDSLKSRAAMVLARSWFDLDNQDSFDALAQSIFPNMQELEEEEEDDDSLNSSNSSSGGHRLGTQESTPRYAPAVDMKMTVHINVKMEPAAAARGIGYDDDDMDIDLDGRLARIPTPPPTITTKQRIVIDLTMMDADDF
jgi:hypothetical protein